MFSRVSDKGFRHAYNYRRTFHGCACAILVAWLGVLCAGIVLRGANGVSSGRVHVYSTMKGMYCFDVT